ncbi:hypothetical protein [Pontibacter sp. G13]|uniref:hypothetical protein n=1 Tax=Pontibacter sp. G13 TaxID=3074898 RepID=UPI00288A2151|nr:hypothetical protein [Pontibacter sp. G13]WNJ16484.1 hypothetical protein RJD25_16585 [Pontibacter sp. G13]
MESFFLKWPDDPAWTVASASADEQGNTVSYQVRPVETDFPEVILITHLGKPAGSVDDLALRHLQNLGLEDFQINQSPHDLERRYILISPEEQEDSFRVFHYSIGKEASYLQIVSFAPEESPSQSVLASWLEFLGKGKILSQPLQQSLAESGLKHILLPSSLPLGVSSKKTLILPEAHPYPIHADLPAQLLFHVWEEGAIKMQWGQILEMGNEWGRVTREGAPPILYVRWDHDRMAWIGGDESWKEKICDWAIESCLGCHSRTPLDLPNEDILPTSWTCRWCGNQHSIHTKPTDTTSVGSHSESR